MSVEDRQVAMSVERSLIAAQHQQLCQAWAVFDELLQDHNRTYRYALRLEIAARAVVQDANLPPDSGLLRVRQVMVPANLIRALEAALKGDET